MATSTIQNIYDEFKADYKNTHSSVIDFYTKHSIFFNNIKAFENKEDLHLYIQLVWQYLNALFQKSYYNDTIGEIDKLLPVINNEINRINEPDLEDEWYNDILLIQGKSYYRLRDYKKATAVFKKLIHKDSKNDNYRIWLEDSRYKSKQLYINIVTYTSLILLIVEMYFRDYHILNKWMRLLLLAIISIGFFGSLTYEHYLKRNFRKKSKK